MDITFNCGSCGQRIVVDEAGAGLGAECPKCGQALTVPRTQPDPSKPPTPSTAIRPRPNAPILEFYKGLKPTPTTDIPPRRIDTGSGVTQFFAWAICFGVLVIGGLLFVSALASATGAPQEAAAGAVFATVFIGAYVFARIVEKVCNLFDRK